MFALYIISAIVGLVSRGCHFHAYLVGSKPPKAFFFFFFKFLQSRNKMRGKKSEI